MVFNFWIIFWWFYWYIVFEEDINKIRSLSKGIKGGYNDKICREGLEVDFKIIVGKKGKC